MNIDTKASEPVTLEEAQAAATGLQAMLSAVLAGERDAKDMNMHALMQLIRYVRQQPTASEPVVTRSFDEWFLGEQGKPYDSMYVFAKAAWNAATPQPAVPDGMVLAPERLSRLHIGQIVDDVFDGALEDESIISDIWAAGIAAAKGSEA